MDRVEHKLSIGLRSVAFHSDSVVRFEIAIRNRRVQAKGLLEVEAVDEEEVHPTKYAHDWHGSILPPLKTQSRPRSI